jgi:integrase
VTLGDCAGMKLEEARRQATEIVNGAKDGRDAAAERAAKREAGKAKTADTLGRLIGIYLERRAKPSQRPRTYAETERYLLKRWAPLHDRPVDMIARRDVAERIERIRVEHGPTAAAHARVYLNGMFSWAVRQGFADHNPVVGTEAPATPPSRARVLKPEELAQIWNNAGDDDFGRIVKLLMLTGQRRSEVAGMRWSELNVHASVRVWTIPASRTKNGREHEVPLSDQAIALLPERRPGRDLVIGRGRVPFAGWAQSKARLDARLGADFKPWRLHDLRHSFVTHAAELGLDPWIVEACVNHQSGHKGGIAGRYNAAQYREQKRVAMERFAQWLTS